MTNVQEALKNAIDEINDLVAHIRDREPSTLFSSAELVINKCKSALADIEKCEPVAEVTAQWVIDFIGSNYNSMRTHDEQGKELPLDEITYSLTVHDLLSAFAYTSPQPRDWDK